MAEKLDAFPATAQRTSYPLDEWLDGSAWKLVQGEDFDRSSTSMRSMLASSAKARGRKLRTRRRAEGGKEVLLVQAYVARDRAQHRLDVFDAGALESLVPRQHVRLRRLKHTVEATQHDHWQDHLAVLRLLVVAPKEVGDRPDERRVVPYFTGVQPPLRP